MGLVREEIMDFIVPELAPFQMTTKPQIRPWWWLKMNTGWSLEGKGEFTPVERPK